MSAITFGSVGVSPRRAAIRRINRPAASPVVINKPPVAIAAHRPVNSDNVRARRVRIGVTIAVLFTIGLHIVVINAFNNKRKAEEAAAKAPPIVIDIAPPKKELPPPPPKVEPPPRVKQVLTPQPILPVVSNVTPSDAPGTETVQVATTPQPPVVAAPPPPEPVTEPKGYAGYLQNPSPEYPSAAQDKGQEGRVILKVHVLANGHPDNVAVGKSSGFSILDTEAIKAVKKWIFQPARRGQTAIDGWVNVPITFKI